MNKNENLYSLKNVSFSYNEKKGCVLENVSFDINQGDFVVVCGVSGSGKTTLLKHLKPAMFPKGKLNGTILFSGNDISLLDEAQQALQIGYVFQDPDSGIVTDKVWHELAFAMEGLLFTKNEIRKRVAEIASFFGIQGIFHSRTDRLSGGQKQLVNLASVMILRPRVIILDEPVSQLDPVSASEFISMLGKINRDFGTTIIISEHRLEELLELCSKVIVLNKSHIDYYGDLRGFSEYISNADETLKEMMTVPMRIFMRLNGINEMPLSVAEGRKWLNSCEKNLASAFDGGSPAKDKYIIKLEDVWFRYENSDVDVLKSLYMKIYKGKVHAIVGENGTGKTTLLSILSGINKPDRGKIKNLSKYSVSLLPQRPELLFSENTVMQELHKCPCRDEKREKIIQMCMLQNLLDYNPYDLSGGERQRLALGIVLTQDTDIILLDEPTKGMDAAFKKTLGSILNELACSGKTIIIVSHDIEFCAMYTEMCYMMFDGEITASADTSKQFFIDNTFYTTATVRMTRDIIDNCVVVDDIIVDDSIPYTENVIKKKQNIERKTFGRFNEKSVMLFSILIYLLIIPLTVYSGSVIWHNKRFYFVALTVIAEAFIPFVFSYEINRPGARRTAVIAVMTAIAVVSRVAFYMLPAMKPIIAVVIISGVALGPFDGFMIGSLSILASNVLFGQGPWTPWQMIGMGLVGYVSGMIFFSKKDNINRVLLCVVGFFETFIIYGISVNVGTVFITLDDVGMDIILKTCIAGIPFDLILSATTVLVLAVASKPFINKLNRVI